MYNFLEVLTISLMHLHDAHPFAHYVASCLHRIERAELCRYKLKQLCPVADSSGWNGVSGRKKKGGRGKRVDEVEAEISFGQGGIWVAFSL